MCGTTNVQVEVWPVAADGAGLWLLSADGPWLSAPIAQDSDPHFEVEFLLARAGVETPPLLHSTSWRPDGPHVVLTYIAVVDVGSLPVAQVWPDAAPIGAALLEAVGTPPTHAADDVPVPRHVDVLVHAIRHVRFLQEFDATAAEALPAEWSSHLARLRPALAGLYSTAHAC